jgi:chromosome segregation ATPase
MSTELEQKEKQLEELQRSFNEYVESSKELEVELETALEDAVNKIEAADVREANSSVQMRELSNRIQELMQENSELLVKSKTNGKINGVSSGGSSNVDELNARIRKMEIENETLNNQVREMEATEEDLRHSLQSLEEDVIFLKTDVEAAVASRAELEIAMNAEVSVLQQKLASSESERRKLNDDIKAMTEKLMKDRNSGNDPADDRVQMLLFKQDADISFIKNTLDALEKENSLEAHRHHEHHSSQESPALRKALEDLRMRLEFTLTENATLTEQVTHYSQRVELHEQLLEEHRSHHSETVDKMQQQHQEELDELRRALQQQQKGRLSIAEAAAVTATAAELAEFKERCGKQDAEIEFLNARLQELEQAKEQLEQANEDLARFRMQLSEERDQALADKEELEGANEDLAKANEMLEAEREELVRSKDQLEQLNEGLESERDELEQAVKALKASPPAAAAAPPAAGVGSYVSNTDISSYSQTSIAIDSTTTTYISVGQVISSEDMELMKTALLRMVH